MCSNNNVFLAHCRELFKQVKGQQEFYQKAENQAFWRHHEQMAKCKVFWSGPEYSFEQLT